MSDKCWLHLKNGWTVSIATSFYPMEPGIVSIAAWPTSQDGMVPVDRVNWFEFSDGSVNLRCYSSEAIQRALNEVEAADSPNV